MFKKSVLDSGITVVTETHRYNRSVSVGAFIKTGTRDESKRTMGVSHFLEHLVFKGTRRRSSSEISRSLEAVGGDLNAFTTREYTCFHATSLRENLKLDIDVLGDLVSQARFSPRDFERERNVILQEIAMTEDNVEEYIFDVFFEKVYNRSSLGWPILGTEESLRGMSRAEVLRYYRDHYAGKNTIVAAAGDLEHDEVVELVEKHFKPKKFKGPRKSRKEPVFNPLREVIEKPGEQAHIIAGFDAVSFTDKRRFEAFVLNSVLGGGMSSRLYQSIRERKGLAYTVYSNLTTFTDCGTLTVYVGTDGKSVETVMDVLVQDLKLLRKKKLNEKGLDLFKQQVRGGILMGADDMENRMSSLGVNEMTFGKYMPVDEVVEGVMAVSAKGVLELAQELLLPEKMAVLVMGPVKVSETEKVIQNL
ncbi:MAG: insulinase family protein [Oligoflexia bacterium]|nr:insulinase family protein [Oligoflexia bacterium]